MCGVSGMAGSLRTDLATLVAPFALDIAAVDEIVLNGVRHSFLSPESKQSLEAAFRREMDALKAVHL